MTKQRSDFLYELVGIIKEKKKTNGERIGYRLIVNLPNQPDINWILAYQDKLANNRIWKDLENLNFVDKQYTFYCHNHFGNYHLINWEVWLKSN